MKFLSVNECTAWCRQHRYEVSEREGHNSPYPELSDSEFHRIEYELPDDSGSKVALARMTFESFDKPGEVLLWLRAWEVWPSSGHLPLFMRLRQSFGADCSIFETPGHLVPWAEQDDALSILVISLEFFWDCFVLIS